MAIPESMNGYTQRAADEQNTWKGHVLVMPYPAQGHVNPMMHLSHHLAALGVLVTFVNTQFNHDRILRSRASSPQLHKYDTEDRIRLVGLPDGLGYDEYVVNFSVPKQAQALADLEPLLMDLVQEAQPPVTCIIADVFVISTLTVARRLDIPHVMFWTQSAASYASHLFFTQNHVSLKEYLKKIRCEGKLNERVISCVPSCPTMSYMELPTFLQPCDPSDFVFSYLIQNFQMAPKSRFVLMNSFGELEEESIAYIHAPNIRCIGPILPPSFILDDNASSLGANRNIPSFGTSFWVEDRDGCLPWFHQQKPSSILYVSFGSVALMSAQQVVEFAVGLEASGCPFLMVVRPEMMEGANVVTFPKGFIEKMKGSGRAAFTAWAPQLEVLAHPAIGGFLTHGGWNSTLESICRGVPMLCWPYFAEQMLNARCVVDTWKIGLDFVTKKVVVNEEWKGQDNNDDINGTITKKENNKEISINSTINTNGNSEEVIVVKSKEIEKKIRQLMDPKTSIEIQTRIQTLSLATSKAYKISSCSTLKSLLEIISN